MSDENSFATETSSESSSVAGPRRFPIVAVVIVAGVILIALVAVVLFRPVANMANQVNRRDLALLALWYHEYNGANARSPTNLEELAAFTKGPDQPFRPAEPDDSVLDRIRNGQIVIIWDAKFGSGEQNDRFVLGYEAKAPTKGGLVIRGGGSVEYMSAKQFNALPKIETKPR